MQVRKGTLLAYDGIYLSEGSWPRKAYRDAAENGRRWQPKRFSGAKLVPDVVSEGHFESEFLQGKSETPQPTLIQPQDPDQELPQPLKEPREVPSQRGNDSADSNQLAAALLMPAHRMRAGQF